MPWPVIALLDVTGLLLVLRFALRIEAEAAQVKARCALVAKFDYAPGHRALTDGWLMVCAGHRMAGQVARRAVEFQVVFKRRHPGTDMVLTYHQFLNWSGKWDSEYQTLMRASAMSVQGRDDYTRLDRSGERWNLDSDSYDDDRAAIVYPKQTGPFPQFPDVANVAT